MTVDGVILPLNAFKLSAVICQLQSGLERVF